MNLSTIDRAGSCATTNNTTGYRLPSERRALATGGAHTVRHVLLLLLLVVMVGLQMLRIVHRAGRLHLACYGRGVTVVVAAAAAGDVGGGECDGEIVTRLQC
uniref:Uncharacterized protein n=1 Tax=Anopheles merus TaxID=30066 RepID=A0A182UZI4_ANOME